MFICFKIVLSKTVLHTDTERPELNEIQEQENNTGYKPEYKGRMC